MKTQNLGTPKFLQTYEENNMFETYYQIATLIILISAFGISISFRIRAHLLGGQLHSTGSQRPIIWLRLFGFVVWLPILAYIVNPNWVAALRVTLPDWLRLGAFIVGLIDLGLIYWMFRTLGLNISPVQEARAGATLVTTGPYRWIRHPLYVFGYLAIVSLMLLSGLIWLIGVTVVPFVMFIRWRVPREEANLIATFGDAYRDYMSRTGRYLPKLNL
ncbi:MAG: isoprenylcysteine carboxylmethyltransferase family protein [Anaerolineae bacterium]|nr:isoprenylcysteine carboxylmethyltransferase family protein [Anaerolineae bacterium]